MLELKPFFSAAISKKMRVAHPIKLFFLPLVSLLSFHTPALADDPKLSLMRATARGVFNIGPSKGALSVESDGTEKPSVLKLTYDAPSGSTVGVWTKGYPADVGPATATTVKISVKSETPDSARTVSVAAEIKGDKDVQRISVPLQAGWATTESVVEWDRVGALKEVVFVVNPVGGPRKGSLLLDLEFQKTQVAPKKVAGVVGITQAGAKGVFNIKTAEGIVAAVVDPRLKKEVFKFDYSVSRGSVVGVWTKGYPSELNPKNYNGFRVALKGDGRPQGGQVNPSLEIKGTKGVQKVPLQIHSGWQNVPHLINWGMVGDLREVVLVLSPAGGDGKGSVWWDLSFVKLPVAKTAPQGTFALSDAAERGVFNTGPAQLLAGSSYDESVGKEVSTLAISASPKSIVGIWTKSYPAAVQPSAVNGVTASVRVPRGSVGQLTAALEIKGTGKDIQRIPLPTQAGWNTVRTPLDWTTIGQLREAVFVVQPDPKLKRLDASVAFDLEFSKGDFPTLPVAAAPAATTGTTAAATTPSSFNLKQAAAVGVFNIKDSEGVVENALDDVVKKEVSKFTYRCPPGSVVGIWSKDYPAGLTKDVVNGVRVAVNVPNAAQLSEISLALELKGDKVQSIPLPLQAGWTTVTEPIDWSAVGSLKEAVFVLKPTEGAERSGVVYLDLDFVQGVFPAKKTAPSGLPKIGWVFLGALGLSLVVKGASRLNKKDALLDGLGGGGKEETPLSRVRFDLLTGVAVVLAVSISLAIYVLGTISDPSPAAGMILGVLGVLTGELFKWTRTKTHLTAGEVFQHFFLTGFLWATSSRQVLWQTPTVWAHVLMKSRLASALACLVYHAANGTRLSSSGKSLRPISGALIAGTPFLFGGLLTLETPALMSSIGSALLWGRGIPGLRELLGRFVVLYAFNAIVANAIASAAKGTLMKTWKAYGWMGLITLGVVVSPYVADWGSSETIAGMSPALGVVSVLVSAMVSQAGLWMEAYFVTGMMLDGLYGYAPNDGAVIRHGATGMKKGMAYSALFLGLLYGIKGLVQSQGTRSLMDGSPVAAGILFGAILFPLVKTIIESFDGSMSFFVRARYSYRQWVLYLRGAVVGGGFAYGLTNGVPLRETGDRAVFGLLVGLLASLGVGCLTDLLNALRRKGRLQSWRVYGVDAAIGGTIGALVAFYLDAVQVTAIAQKFLAYTSLGLEKTDFTVYALVSKWGRVDLGGYTGGVKLLFDEALAGLLTWSIAAPLFAVNRVFMTAYFQRDKAPIRYFFSKAGATELTVNLIHVMRWGLWMSPIINTGIRMMAKATWYNQDGAIRTLVAIYKNLTLSPADFQLWSLGVFVSLLAFDAVRVLIWLDHMGLRVATLVNLSFIGMDKLDEKIARFIGPSSAQRFLPEGVKRFTTWAPLLIPFYIPRGEQWDFAWTTSEQLQKASAGAFGLTEKLLALSWGDLFLIAGGGAVGVALLSAVGRALSSKQSRGKPKVSELANLEYKVVVQSDGAAYSQVAANGYDLTRRPYDTLDPAGRALFLVDTARPSGTPGRTWPVLGNFPADRFSPSLVERGTDSIWVVNTSQGVRATLEIKLPDARSTAERWTLTVENLTDAPKELKVVPYLEWVLDRPESDRGHTQYGRLFPEMEYVQGMNAILSWQKKTKTMGFIASDVSPEGFLTSRMDFIGRARSLWSPRVLETLSFLDAHDTRPYPTFDPIGSLLLGIRVDAKSSRTVKFLAGYAKDRDGALASLRQHLNPRGTTPAAQTAPIKKADPLIGHGEIPPGTPLPYSEYKDDGNTLVVRTPFTPRPYDHALSNAVGHYVMVTNRGLHTTSNGNSQQNPVTPDWPDTVTRELPSEAIYLYDTETAEWFSPTHHPLNDLAAKHECAFSVNGTARFSMKKGTLETELTVFVPPDEPTGVYLLTVKNNSTRARRLRVAPYFQIALAGQAESRRPALQIHKDEKLNAVFFENPGNAFRKGPAFAAMSLPWDRVETKRGKFMGVGRGVANPILVEKGEPDPAPGWDDRPVAGFLGTLEVPPLGERTLVVLLGQTDSKKKAADIIRKYKNVDTARQRLDDTRRWWMELMSTVNVQTNQLDFDQYQNWLKYQAVAERLWARRGFYQTSGAFGFRDQLQDSVNLIWVNPALARKQILLHASQQFIEGDVVHWFHTLHDMRSAFSNRSHASDNLLWLAWGAAEYVRMTGDESILEERTSYLKGENPFLPLPKNKHGWGTIYLRSRVEDTVYRHCMKSIDLVLEKRMGEHGLPLIGTGDWNDGLDEIGSEGRGESVWLGFFLHYILQNMVDWIEKKDGRARKEYYLNRLQELGAALEHTWREDRYLRAFHDNGAEIGVKDSGVWEIDALTAAWAVYAGINPERNRIVFQTALNVLEKENVILLGWPALREDTKPYLGRSSHYPEGVRENGMYCHGVQWLVRAARLLAERAEKDNDPKKAAEYRETAYRLWMKIAPLSHLSSAEIERYGGQPNKQSADMLTTYDPGRMIWHGYTGAAGWMLRQAFEGIVGAQLVGNRVVLPEDLKFPRGSLRITSLKRQV